MKEPASPYRAVVDEADLFRAGRSADVEAFTRLVALHDRGMRALAYRLLSDRDRMDDVLQEAYLRAFRGLPSFEGRSTVRAWLYRIVYNACLDDLRRRRRRREVPLQETLERADPGPDPGEVAAGRRDLGAALASLSPDIRATVLLVDADGMDYESAAEVLGVPVGTVRSRLNRGRAVLRSALSEEER